MISKRSCFAKKSSMLRSGLRELRKVSEIPEPPVKIAEIGVRLKEIDLNHLMQKMVGPEGLEPPTKRL